MISKYTLVPSADRVIVRYVNLGNALNAQQNILIPGQLKAGENLLMGEVVHPGTTKFKVGQLVYYSEYSASAVINMGSLKRGEESYTEAVRDENKFIVVAEDDIMAYEEEK